MARLSMSPLLPALITTLFSVSFLAPAVLATDQDSTFTSITGPLLNATFPDPGIIQLGNGTYYAFSSRNGKINTPVATSSSYLSDWHLIFPPFDALPDAGPWTTKDPHALTPAISELANGSFILYYIAVPKQAESKIHCIGAATSPNITGPYTPLDNPILCPPVTDRVSGSGTADPSSFLHNGTSYLVFKNASGHDPQRQSYLAIVEVGTDGLPQSTTAMEGLQNTWTDILNSTAADQDDVEGSCLVLNPNPGPNGEGRYVLFFTAGTFNTTNLRLEYATSDAVMGPYTRQGIILRTGDMYNGGQSVIVAPTGLDAVERNVSQVVFEAFVNGTNGRRVRQMFGAEVSYNGTKVSIL